MSRMFSLGMPTFQQNFSKCFLSSGRTSGFRAIGRVTVTAVSSASDAGVPGSRAGSSDGWGNRWQ